MVAKITLIALLLLTAHFSDGGRLQLHEMVMETSVNMSICEQMQTTGACDMNTPEHMAATQPRHNPSSELMELLALALFALSSVWAIRVNALQRVARAVHTHLRRHRLRHHWQGMVGMFRTRGALQHTEEDAVLA